MEGWNLSSGSQEHETRTSATRRRQLGGTFAEYPENYGESAFALLQTVAFTLVFAILATLIALRIRDEEFGRRKVRLNNRHLIVASVFFGSSMRVVYIPIVDTVESTPDWCIYGFRATKDLLWFTAFALLVAFWMEIQVKTSRNTFTVERYRPHLIGVITIYCLLRVSQMGLEIAAAPAGAKILSKALVGTYLAVLFVFSGYWGWKLRTRLDSMANSKGKSTSHHLKNSLQTKVRRLTNFMVLETCILVFLTFMSGLDLLLKNNDVVNPAKTPAACLGIKVVQRFTEFTLIFVLWRMLFVKKAASESLEAPCTAQDQDLNGSRISMSFVQRATSFLRRSAGSKLNSASSGDGGDLIRQSKNNSELSYYKSSTRSSPLSSAKSIRRNRPSGSGDMASKSIADSGNGEVEMKPARQTSGANTTALRAITEDFVAHGSAHSTGTLGAENARHEKSLSISSFAAEQLPHPPVQRVQN